MTCCEWNRVQYYHCYLLREVNSCYVTLILHMVFNSSKPDIHISTQMRPNVSNTVVLAGTPRVDGLLLVVQTWRYWAITFGNVRQRPPLFRGHYNIYLGTNACFIGISGISSLWGDTTLSKNTIGSLAWGGLSRRGLCMISWYSHQHGYRYWLIPVRHGYIISVVLANACWVRLYGN